MRFLLRCKCKNFKCEDFHGAWIPTRVWHESPEFEAGAFGRGQVRAQQVRVFIACCSVAAWQEEKVT